ncbi:MAG: hypothetical protein NT007_08165 [Candidatus Kapabacteria bacterium]|nr:hypothetical protein [Candidatus Kapabacteria bacterium]
MIKIRDKMLEKRGDEASMQNESKFFSPFEKGGQGGFYLVQNEMLEKRGGAPNKED